MSKIALFVIYNHRYDRNIPIIENLYKKQFSHIFHLMPFYEGEQENVLPVYESSYRFQSYIAQAYNTLNIKHLNKWGGVNFTHYFIISDDALMNPNINENNLFEFLCIDEQSCYLKDFRDVRQKNPWSQVYAPLLYKIRQKGVEVADILPSAQQAAAKFAEHALDIPDKVKYARLLTYPFWYFRHKWMRNVLKSLKLLLQFTFRSRKIAYPLIWGGADYALIPASTMPKFCTYCGAFAATGLFVEYAIPTALVLSAEKIVTEAQTGKHSIFNDGKKIKSIELQYDFKLDMLVRNFPENVPFIHPVKLSKWK
ncbi:MAG: hypothetical protein LBG92_07680 [Prevotellaceae bacterium]|jgi:hypothetical protein|nr:hypothetical protein [Prevotellaceae bacterium]